MEISKEEKFRLWVLVPIEALRKIEKGDGAFAALALIFGLYERYLDSKLHRKGESANKETFRREVAADLECDESLAEVFWNQYRDGMQHAFHPLSGAGRTGTSDVRGWDMGSTSDYKKSPELVVRGNWSIIKIDPWKFVDHVLARWRENLDLLNELKSFNFGEIKEIEKSEMTSSNWPESVSHFKTVYEGPPIPPAT
jgi:hypothetical protein